MGKCLWCEQDTSPYLKGERRGAICIDTTLHYDDDSEIHSACLSNALKVLKILRKMHHKSNFKEVER